MSGRPGVLRPPLHQTAVQAAATSRIQVTPNRSVSIPKAGAHRAGPQVDPAVLLALGDAIRAREELRFGYRSPTGDEQDAPRRVQPQHLVVRAGRWYHPSSGRLRRSRPPGQQGRRAVRRGLPL